MRPLRVALAIIDLAVAAACSNPMEPVMAQPAQVEAVRERNCEVFPIEADSVTSAIPVELRCSARVRVVCG